MFGLKKARTNDRRCHPFVFDADDFRHDLLRALGMSDDNVTSVILTFDMNDIARVVVEKHADISQCERLVKVLRDHGISRELGDEPLEGEVGDDGKRQQPCDEG